MNGMFDRRARASEGSWGRDADKANLLKRKERLKAEGKLADPSSTEKQNASVTVDVLAEISANEVPIGKTIGAQHSEPNRHVIRVNEPDPALGEPELPSQARVAAEIYQRHMGKKTWFNELTKAIEPGSAAAELPTLYRNNADPLRTMSRREAQKIQAQAKGSAMAAASVVLGTFVCTAGAMLAGVAMWRYYGRPDRAGVEKRVQQTQFERKRQLNEGVVGESVRVVGAEVKKKIAEHEGYHNFAAGIKQQFGGKRGDGPPPVATPTA